MKLSLLLAIKAIISLLFGILLAVIPAQFMAILGATLNPDGVLLARLVGALLIGIGLICWLSRNKPEDSLQDIVLSLFVADTLGFIVVLMGQMAGITTSAFGWVNVVLWLLLALGLGYFRFIKSSA